MSQNYNTIVQVANNGDLGRYKDCPLTNQWYNGSMSIMSLQKGAWLA